MSEIKSVMKGLCDEVGESTMVQYYPVLRFTGLDLKKVCVLSYILGWNMSGRPCFISKEKIGNMFQISNAEVEVSVSELLKKGYITSTDVQFNNTTSKGFKVDLEFLQKSITTNDEYHAISTIRKLSEDLKKNKKK